MKYLLNSFFTFLLFGLSSIVSAQFELKDSVFFDFKNISHLKVNEVGDVFFINNEKDLIKIDQHKKITRFPLTKLVSHLDTTLTLKTAVLYNYQELIILDDQLKPIQDPINLNSYEIFPTAITLSDSQNLWYFDPIEQRLVQWNYQIKKTISRSNPIEFKSNDSVIQSIYQIKNRLFIKSENCIYEYDLFGNFKAIQKLPNHISYSYYSRYILLKSDSDFKRMDLLNKEISLLDNFFYGKDFIMNEEQLFVINDKVMYIYTRIKK